MNGKYVPRGLIIRKIKSYSVSQANVAAGATVSATVSIDAQVGNNRIAVIRTEGWANISSITLSGTTATVSLVNTSAGTHTASASFYVIEYD